jgi:glycosyltransferase involved in cell wall biosynthesis
VTLRVALDARQLALPGISRYLVGLWGALAERSTMELVPLVARGDRATTGWLGDAAFAPLTQGRPVRSRPFLPAEQVALPLALRQARADVFHSPHLSVPYFTRRPVVLTVHDLHAFRELGNARSVAAGAYYRAVFPMAIRRADAIVAVSALVARDIEATFPRAASKVDVIEHGIDHGHWRPVSKEVRTRHLDALGIDEPYLLYVGTAKPHKNLELLLRTQRTDDPLLVLAGPTEAEITPYLGLGSGRRLALGRVVATGDLLPALYSGAVALLMPSRYESVGFPVLEAMACGAPVLSTDGGALADTVGDGGVVVPSEDPVAWRAALDQLLQDEQARADLREAGRRHVSSRSWHDCAQRHEDVYRRLAA